MRNRIFFAFVTLAVCSSVGASSALVVNGQVRKDSGGQTALVKLTRDKLLRLSNELQSHLEDLRPRLGDDHPDVIAIRRRLQRVEKALLPVNLAWLLSKDADTLEDTELLEAVKILARQVAHLNARVSEMENVRVVPINSP